MDPYRDSSTSRIRALEQDNEALRAQLAKRRLARALFVAITGHSRDVGARIVQRFKRDGAFVALIAAVLGIVASVIFYSVQTSDVVQVLYDNHGRPIACWKLEEPQILGERLFIDRDGVMIRLEATAPLQRVPVYGFAADRWTDAMDTLHVPHHLCESKAELELLE